MRFQNLIRPSRLTLLWPRLLIVQPLSIYFLRTAYRSRASLAEMVNDTVDTLERFFSDWLLEPVRASFKLSELAEKKA